MQKLDQGWDSVEFMNLIWVEWMWACLPVFDKISYFASLIGLHIIGNHTCPLWPFLFLRRSSRQICGGWMGHHPIICIGICHHSPYGPRIWFFFLCVWLIIHSQIFCLICIKFWLLGNFRGKLILTRRCYGYTIIWSLKTINFCFWSFLCLIFHSGKVFKILHTTKFLATDFLTGSIRYKPLLKPRSSLTFLEATGHTVRTQNFWVGASWDNLDDRPIFPSQSARSLAHDNWVWLLLYLIRSRVIKTWTQLASMVL